MQNCESEVATRLGVEEAALCDHVKRLHLKQDEKGLSSVDAAYTAVLGPSTSEITRLVLNLIDTVGAEQALSCVVVDCSNSAVMRNSLMKNINLFQVCIKCYKVLCNLLKNREEELKS